MSEFKLTSVEEFEQATNELLETGAKVGADAWQFRVKNQTPHCKFGEQGTCCRICTMGPCRITPKAPRGICGCDVHGIVGRNFLRFTAGGSATHSDHGREICHTLHEADPNGNYKVKDPEKLIRIAKEWGVETEGKDIYDLAHELAACQRLIQVIYSTGWTAPRPGRRNPSSRLCRSGLPQIQSRLSCKDRSSVPACRTMPEESPCW